MGLNKSEMTGTPLFMALSVAWGDAHTVSSDLESLFYALLYIASDGAVSDTTCPWYLAGRATFCYTCSFF